ncbi:uncharacterized protein F5Z01DRAFT_639898 [Emericellopsis atlantica]|uniref:Uncharacterized protein n=1 Tax=Emericellopsis atlantica TaxID=2614577 RepID=A0A9P7ZF60_9HYPO|nr:uncharacterized protein F5Z01DRAFT_639898 [Emericellopsis atlantica]KAG9250811.1 hypothetical protein F5Z01DRAFT_639898 [Emericellopsis atlantica]
MAQDISLGDKEDKKEDAEELAIEPRLKKDKPATELKAEKAKNRAPSWALLMLECLYFKVSCRGCGRDLAIGAWIVARGLVAPGRRAAMSLIPPSPARRHRTGTCFL